MKVSYGMDFDVVMSDDTRDRLATTCFREGPVKKSGNFFAWTEMQVLALTGEVRSSISKIANSVIARDITIGTHRIMARFSQPVGWSSTLSIAMAGDGQLERRNLNRSSTALFVCNINQPAPKTCLATLVFSVTRIEGHWVVEILTAYPGKDVGELRGDVTSREGRVFFDFSNPGSDSWVCDE